MTYFKSFTFTGKKSARKAIDAIDDKSDIEYMWLDDVAEISVNSKGQYRVHSTWAQDSSYVPAGIGFGALCGGLVGLMFGPAGALAGATIAGSIGGLLGHQENVILNDPILEDFAKSLNPDTSALVILGDEATIEEFTNELSEYEVLAFETELNEEMEKELKKAMKN